MVGVTVRTLQRWLRMEGTIFSELLARIRHERSCELLGDPDISIADVARHLGYSEVSNFTHAFRRWTGRSPTQYRADLEQGVQRNDPR
jgi:AraC-like DNA-binding protein